MTEQIIEDNRRMKMISHSAKIPWFFETVSTMSPSESNKDSRSKPNNSNYLKWTNRVYQLKKQSILFNQRQLQTLLERSLKWLRNSFEITIPAIERNQRINCLLGKTHARFACRSTRIQKEKSTWNQIKCRNTHLAHKIIRINRKTRILPRSE